MENISLSSAPENKLAALAYEGQPKSLYNYVSGFETLLSQLPNPSKFTDETFSHGVKRIKKIMHKVVKKGENTLSPPPKRGFKRSIVAVEEVEGEGQEVLFAHWGKGFASPVHGHNEGLLYEYLVSGSMLINEYVIVDLPNKIARPHKSYIQKKGEIVTTYTKPGTHKMHVRESFIHNFVALEPTTTLHYVPEHTRDGRDNEFSVEYFDVNPKELKQVNGHDAMYSRVGDVILVRSQNVPEYGDHYIIIVGRPVQKEHGLRPKDVSVLAGPQGTAILDQYSPMNGLTLLKLSDEEKKRFLEFHKY